MSEIRVVSWNVAGGMLKTPDGRDVPEADTGQYIGRIVRKTAADVVALQEVLFTDRAREVSAVPEIARVAGYRYYYTKPLNPSHLHEDPAYGSGLTILSHRPIESPSLQLVPNPRLTHVDPDGSILSSHDKGYLVSEIRFGSTSVRFANVHFLPYHDFERDAADDEFRGIWRTIDDTLFEWAKTPAIVAGDFNAWPLEPLLPNSWGCFRSAVDGATRPNGARHDQVLLSPHCTWVASEIRESPSDHHLCVVDTRL